MSKQQAESVCQASIMFPVMSMKEFADCKERLSDALSFLGRYKLEYKLTEVKDAVRGLEQSGPDKPDNAGT